MNARIVSETLSSGLALAVENIPGLASVSFAFLIPMGAAVDPEGKCGLTALASEMILRGAGDRDARALTEELDGLGIERSVDYSSEYLMISGSCLSTKIADALPVFRDILLAPRLDEDELAPSIDLIIQSILAIEDSPTEKLFQELGQRYLPYPLGRPARGIADEVASATTNDLRSLCNHRSPRGMIFSIAGDIEAPEARDFAIALFENIPPAPDYPIISLKPARVAPAPSMAPATLLPPHGGATSCGSPDECHIVKEDAHQVQIGMALPSIAMTHPDYLKALLGVTVLSGGMSGRLFVEVREKRGLVYSVRASYSAMRDRGDIYVYAGTTPERATETEAVVRGELDRLATGITEEELARARTQLRSSFVMSQESSRYRATTMVSDLFRLGHVRDPEEIVNSIRAIELDEMNAFLARFEPKPFVMTLGPARTPEKKNDAASSRDRDPVAGAPAAAEQSHGAKSS